jgi:hypothetical protein
VCTWCARTVPRVDALVAGDVPQLHRLVVTAGDRQALIRRELRGAHPVQMARHRCLEPPSRQAPHLKIRLGDTSSVVTLVWQYPWLEEHAAQPSIDLFLRHRWRRWQTLTVEDPALPSTGERRILERPIHWWQCIEREHCSEALKRRQSACDTKQTLTLRVLSSDAVSRWRPSRAKDTERTVPLCALMTVDLPSTVGSHRRTVRSLEPDAMRSPAVCVVGVCSVHFLIVYLLFT